MENDTSTLNMEPEEDYNFVMDDMSIICNKNNKRLLAKIVESLFVSNNVSCIFGST